MVPEISNNYQSANGTWSGVIGLLVSDQADVGTDKYVMTVFRFQVINYMSTAFKLK